MTRLGRWIDRWLLAETIAYGAVPGLAVGLIAVDQDWSWMLTVGVVILVIVSLQAVVNAR